MKTEFDLDDPALETVVPFCFGPHEVEWYESHCPILAENQPADLCSTFQSVTEVRSLHLSQGGLETIEKEFRFAALFHGARGRPALRKKYVHIADVVHLVFLETVN